MGRITCLILLAVSTAIAAPPPKETPQDRLRRLYGMPYDPEKDSTITLDGSRLRIQMPGTPHRFTPGYESEKSSAPRVRRELSGDFDIRVRVVSVTTPKPMADGLSMTAGGLFIGTDDNTFITISRYVSAAVDDRFTPQFLFQPHLPDTAVQGSGLQPNEAKDKPIYLRLVREKKSVTAYSSTDGKTWKERGTQKYAWPDKVFVGVFASHGTGHPVEGVFDEFDVLQPSSAK